MFDKLQAMAWGVVLFGVIVVLGTVLLSRFGAGIATCGTGFTVNTSAIPANCYNTTNASQATVTPTGSGYVTSSYLITELGSTSGGLASWTPAILVLGIALIFIGAFGLYKGKEGRY